MSELYQSLSHSKWDCKYHVVFVPKRRRKAIFGQALERRGHGRAGNAESLCKSGWNSSLAFSFSPCNGL